MREAVRLSAYASFRSLDYRLLFLGNLLSSFGLTMLSVAVSWDLYVQTKSAAVLGNVGFVQVAPFLLLALPAGHLADRYERRRVLVFTQLLLVAASVLLVVAPPSVSLIFTVLFLTASARALQGPSRLGLLPHAVPAELLGNAIAWNSSAQEIATVSGPALGGILVATTGSRTVYVVQFMCAILTLLCFQFLSLRVKTAQEKAPSVKALLDGIQFVRKSKLILPAISLDLFAVLFGGATALLPIYAVEILHTGATGLGWLRAAPSIGAVTMALVFAHAPKVKHAGQALMWSVAGFGAATVVFGFSRWLWLSFLMLILTGAFDNVSVVLRNSLVQTQTPDRLRGRVLAVNNIFISCSNQLGAVESGWTAAWFGAVPSVAGGGLATIAIVVAFASGSAALRNWKQ